jgi:TRAP-type C4-dicarboxylate transport system permease large subunit
MKFGRARIRNILLISLLVPLIILVGIWGGWFGPLELSTCTARGGQVIGDYGSGDV